MNAVVMEGPLRDGDLDLQTVLQAVSMSRQYTVIRLQDADRRATGEIRLKSGHVVTATRGEERGRDAFFHLLHDTPRFFQVERERDPDHLPDPIGTVVSLLLDEKRPRLHAVAPLRPSPPVAAPQVESPAPPAPPRVVARPQVNPSVTTAPPAPSISINDAAARVPGLQAVVVSSRADGLPCCAWKRHDRQVDVEAWAAFAGQLEHAARACMALTLAPGTDVITLEHGPHVFVVRPLDGDLIAAFAFERSIPLGYIRLQIKRLAPDLLVGRDR